MAELLIKIGDGADYTDGDCICAFSDRRISCCNAEMICHPRKTQRNESGLFPLGSLAGHWMQQVCEYRFERISATEIERVTQATNQRERFGPDQIDVRLFVRRRKQSPNHCLFGEDGAEVWFGGRSDYSVPTLNRIWKRIEQDTTHRRNDGRNRLWSMGRLEIRHHLALRVDALTEKQVADFMEPQYEVDGNGDFVWDLIDGDTVSETQVTASIDTPPDDRQGWRIVTAAKRRRGIPWRDVLGDLAESEANVIDQDHPIGHEHDEPEGKRYTSKTQVNQRHTRIGKKTPKVRG